MVTAAVYRERCFPLYHGYVKYFAHPFGIISDILPFSDSPTHVAPPLASVSYTGRNERIFGLAPLSRPAMRSCGDGDPREEL